MALKLKLTKVRRKIERIVNRKRTDSFLFQELKADICANPELYLKACSGLSYGRLRNLASWLIPCNKSLSSFRISLIVEQPEVLHFNHIKIWVKNSLGHIVEYTQGFECKMSSCAEVLPDPALVLSGNENNTVSIHSKRELKPWWEIQFHEPQHVAFIQVFNRKDSFGKRFYSALLQGYDAKKQKIFESSRVQKKYKLELLNNEFLAGIETVKQHHNSASQNDKLKNWFDSIRHLANNPSELSKQLVKQSIYDVFDSLAIKTPDVGTESENALCFNISNAQYIRVLSFRKRQPREAELYLSINGDKSLVKEVDVSHANAAVLKLKQKYKHLPNSHFFETKLNTQQSSEVRLWAKDHYSSDLLVLRQVQVSSDGVNWRVIESTLEPFGAALAILQSYEYMFGEQWSAEFANRVGIFFGVYRLHLARAFKGLLGSVNRSLLPSYYEGVIEGGKRSKYLPRVVYTRHGLSVPFSELSSNFIANRMKEFCDVLEEHFGLKAFPCYGTLLGIYRDNDFLPHDDDVDLAVVVDLPSGFTYRERTEYWVDKLAEIGIKSAPPTPTSLNLHCYFKDFDMDLFFIYPSVSKPKHLWTHMEQYKVRNVNSNLILPLDELTFLGHQYYTPKNVEAFLADRYGSGWSKPDPYFEL